MNSYLVVVILFILGFTRTHANCTQNTICFEARDTINQVNEEAVRSEIRQGRGHRAWYIRPESEEFNAILAFKNFSASPDAEVTLIAYSAKGKTTYRRLNGELGNFETVFTATIGVMVFVPLHENRTINFVLNYYTGCEIMESSQDQVSYFPPNEAGFVQKKCWLIQPSDNFNKKMIYFSIRDALLSENNTLMIWDIHTSQMIAITEEREKNRLVRAQITSYPFVLIDLVCTGNHCNNASNSFFMSYYAMNESEVNCIANTEKCINSNNTGNCNMSCPTLNRMILEEHAIEVQPLVRSGIANDQKRNKCPLPRKYCRCPSNNIRRDFYCLAETKCLKLISCAWRCIVNKVTYCLRSRSLQNSITLL